MNITLVTWQTYNQGMCQRREINEFSDLQASVNWLRSSAYWGHAFESCDVDGKVFNSLYNFGDFCEKNGCK